MREELPGLPLLKDSVSYIYIDHAVVEQRNNMIIAVKATETITIPITTIACILLGPGTSITHAAIKLISASGGMIIWCGEGVERFYASGIGETRNSKNVLKQVELFQTENLRLKAICRMYSIRFPNMQTDNLSIEQMRGMESIRMREAYKNAAKNTAVEWNGKRYNHKDWQGAEPIQKALVIANSLLYGICHASIVSLGYSPALVFIHSGSMLSFVYDVADLYKADISIPAAFEAVADGSDDLNRSVRVSCRKYFEKYALLKRIAKDISWIMAKEE